jgi:hypothetical protein
MHATSRIRTHDPSVRAVQDHIRGNVILILLFIKKDQNDINQSSTNWINLVRTAYIYSGKSYNSDINKET